MMRVKRWRWMMAHELASGKGIDLAGFTNSDKHIINFQ